MAGTTLASASDAQVASRSRGATNPANTLRTTDPQALLRELTASWHHESTVVNRRHSHRIPCEIVAALLPIDDRDQVVRTEPQAILIANLSKCGVGIVHHQPLPYRQAMIEYELASGTLVRLLVRLKWCRFKGADCYESGGQILQVLQDPIPSPGSASEAAPLHAQHEGIEAAADPQQGDVVSRTDVTALDADRGGEGQRRSTRVP